MSSLDLTNSLSKRRRNKITASVKTKAGYDKLAKELEKVCQNNTIGNQINVKKIEDIIERCNDLGLGDELANNADNPTKWAKDAIKYIPRVFNEDEQKQAKDLMSNVITYGDDIKTYFEYEYGNSAKLIKGVRDLIKKFGGQSI